MENLSIPLSEVVDSQVPNESQTSDRRSQARNWTPVEMLYLAAAKKLELEKDLANVGQHRFLNSI